MRGAGRPGGRPELVRPRGRGGGLPRGDVRVGDAGGGGPILAAARARRGVGIGVERPTSPADPRSLHSLHILVHRFQELCQVGVAFSRDPTAPGHAGILVEVAPASGSVVGGGASGLRRFTIDSDGATPTEAAIAHATRTLAGSYGEVDLEWGTTTDGELVVLQARAMVSDGGVRPSEAPPVVSFDSPMINRIRVGPHYGRMLNWYFNKRYWCYAVCREQASSTSASPC